MTRIIRAELIRFARRRTMIIAAAVTVTFSIVTTLAVFSSAQSSGIPHSRGQTTLAILGDSGGGTEAFALGGAFVGFFVFATFIAILAGEFSAGTFRALLLRDPRRRRVIIGKCAGILIIAATIVAFAEVSTFVVSLLVAPTKDIEISDWFSVGSMVAGLGNYATVLGGVAGWAVFGTTLAVIIRSVPLAIGVGIAWSGPFENIVAQSWAPGYRFFPGQVLASLIQGGTTELGLGRATLTAILYTGIAATATLVLVSRTDM